MILSDFHVHPDFSIDAVGTIFEFCKKASELSLGAICFTTHYDYNPATNKSGGRWKYKGSKVALTDEIVAVYLKEIGEARDIFAKQGLTVYSGVEIDYTPGAEKEAERLRSIFRFDFVLGSVHCINGYEISEDSDANEYFNGRSIEQMADEYFALLQSAASCSIFDALGHLDYYVRYGRKYYGDAVYDIDIERYDPVFEVLKKNGIGIELNTSPYKRGEAGFHPSTKILERAIDSGVGISSVGSDCHKPEELGKGIKEGFQYLSSKKVIPRYPL